MCLLRCELATIPHPRSARPLPSRGEADAFQLPLPSRGEGWGEGWSPAATASSSLPRASGDEQLAYFADGAVAAAGLGDVAGDGFHGRGRVGNGAGQADAFEGGQVIEIVADESHVFQVEAVSGAQLVDRHAFVGRAAVHVVDLQLRGTRMDDRAVFARDDGHGYADLAHARQTHAIARVELL